jgi:two-component system cell cycle sensor histidine kinase/response regulator CckA
MSEAPRTVLIVDDDPNVLRLVEKMLKARQVNVLVAPRPSDALQICERQMIHLLISDVAMPEMDGTKLADRVLKLQPAASVLLISGHYKDDEGPARNPRMRFLSKPFFPSQLLAHLRELLPEETNGGSTA